MGLIKAALGAAGGALADQWRDFFSCDSMDENVLVVKGTKKSSDRSSNKRGETNVISDGSGIAVADGQCMMIVEQGKVIEFCAEPGLFTYRNDLTPSIFAGEFEFDLEGAARDAWERFTFGGGVGKDQRIYYFNIKEIYGNKYGTMNPVPFKVVIDKDSGKSLGVDLRCNGEYSYRIVNPMLFYTNVCGNVENRFERGEIESQMKSELLKALQPALARVSAMGVDYSEIPLYTDMIADGLNDVLTKEWIERRGVQIVSFGVNSVSVSEKDKLKIQNLQQAVMMSDPTMAAGNLVQAQADAMRAAAENENGAMGGFVGMGMAGMAGGMNSENLFEMGRKQQNTEQRAQPQTSAGDAEEWTCKCGTTTAGKFCPECGNPKPDKTEEWTCKCGITTAGKFCPQCGSPRPEKAAGWTCECGAVNKGRFCTECGAKKPAEASLYKCDKCGWEPENPQKPPKFCPQCGDIFDDNDVR